MERVRVGVSLGLGLVRVRVNLGLVRVRVMVRPTSGEDCPTPISRKLGFDSRIRIKYT